MKRSLAFVFILFLAACGNDNNGNGAQFPIVATTPSANSEAFNRPFGLLMNYYFELKDDLVDEKDSSAINHAALQMMTAADSLPLTELKADSTVIAMIDTYRQSVSSELKGLLGETELTAKRKEFQIVSDQLYDLVRAVRYDRIVLYHTYCPAAFSDQGAYWLSNTPAIKNPYVPHKTPVCGEIKDTIDFRRK